MRRYVILDVFTSTPLAGNPLAVILDADGLDDARMQAIAREFNLSETVFVLPPANKMHSASLRIFTPGRELPFAGHPTVGTAVALARQKVGADGGEMMLVLEEKVGPIRCGVFIKSQSQGHAIFDLPRTPEPVEAKLDREVLAAALGLVPAEIGFENHQPMAFTAGSPYVFVPLRDLDTIARAAPRSGAWAAALGGVSHAMYLYCRQTVTGGHAFHARCFAPGVGIPEDPATGGAAAAFAGVVSRFDQLTAGSHRLLIEQGLEMGRPSLITLEIDMEGVGIAGARIGGDAVVVAEGSLDA